MDISDTIKNLFSGLNADAVLPIINLLRENSFDIKKVAQNLTPEKIIPIVQSLAASKDGASPKSDTFSASAPQTGTLAIANVADKEIVYCLNRYLSTEESI